MVPTDRLSASPLPASYRYVEAWGMNAGHLGRVLEPRSVTEVVAAFELARAEGVTLGPRGAGNSYGDASLNSVGHVLDLRGLDRILSWDAETGIADLEAGVTIEALWKRSLPDGWWPAVVPGTMFPTVGGLAAMNAHGKNDYRVGSFGDQILEIDLVLPSGEVRTCDRERHPALFHAAVGGLGLLGCVSRVKVRTKRVHSGELWVRAISVRNLREALEEMEARRDCADYLVGWLDGFAGGDGLGRGLLHEGRHLAEGEDDTPERSLSVAHQELADSILGFPKSQLWRVLRLLNHDPGMRLVNALKHHSGRLEALGDRQRWTHAAFSFLLDYVPNWKWSYGRRGRRGLIQFQAFVPHEAAGEVFAGLLADARSADCVPYLAVLKRHRPGPFLLTHALDGWSLALDFKVTPQRRATLWGVTERLTDRVLEARGRFYFAKDSLLRPGDVRRFLPPDALAAFAELKRELDPEHLLQTDLSRRALGDVCDPQEPCSA
ncbi:MAG: FAD-binding oxidoreductase [Planctomycetota bacterium]|jgi:FAD/FMN-containing dehydrogenase|nr:FAD-binding oxidoreductase [Planctomycetota bacterium]MDP6763863.1 FAD-binding oxidoreductase [Planctomycetota bacterium]MDP6989658.1 FAD-binding oxidoreductase [Planctomycetota bacterium]